MSKVLVFVLSVIGAIAAFFGLKRMQDKQNAGNKLVINSKIKEFFNKKEEASGEKSVADSIDDFNKHIK